MFLDINVDKSSVCINGIVHGGGPRARGVKEGNCGEALRVKVEVLGALRGYFAGRANLLDG
jgi:hypothetical protein